MTPIRTLLQRGAFFFCALFAMSGSLLAQNLELRFTEFKDNKVLIHYSLRDSISGRLYIIRLYSSRDNFLNPLEKVTGEVGLEIKPGVDNIIAWDVQSELDSLYNGRISFEIRGRFFVPFINAESIDRYGVFKRSRKYNLTWSGGSPQNILNFDLYRGKTKVHSFPNIGNVGYHSIEFPTSIKPGSNYHFRISDAKNRDEVVSTTSFKIKRKVPLAFKTIPLIAIGYGSYVVFSKAAADDFIGDPPTKF